MFPQQRMKNESGFFELAGDQPALCFSHAGCVFHAQVVFFKEQMLARNISLFFSFVSSGFFLIGQVFCFVWILSILPSFSLLSSFLPSFLSFLFTRVKFSCPTPCLLQVLHSNEIAGNKKGGTTVDPVSHRALNLEGDHMSKRVGVQTGNFR